MTKRLQVILTDLEYRAIQRAARSRHMSITEWVRHALDFAHCREREELVLKKLAVIRAATQFDFPTSDIDLMAGESESGSSSC